MIGVGVLAAQSADGTAPDSLIFKIRNFFEGVFADFADREGGLVLKLDDLNI